MKANMEAVLHTAEGDTKYFTGVVARFVSSHPRLSAILALAAGLLIGHFLPH